MHFELVTLTGDGVSVEVPASFFAYDANTRLERITGDDGEVYYQIWHLGQHVGVYLHGGSGVIYAGPRLDLLVFANSTARHFVECVRGVAAIHPFYGEDPEWEELDRAGRNLEVIIQEIDPPAAGEGTFWSDFISDVAMGSYVE